MLSYYIFNNELFTPLINELDKKILNKLIYIKFHVKNSDKIKESKGKFSLAHIDFNFFFEKLKNENKISEESESETNQYFEIKSNIIVDLSKTCFCCNIVEVKNNKEFITQIKNEVIEEKTIKNFFTTKSLNQNNNLTNKPLDINFRYPKISFFNFFKSFSLDYDKFLLISETEIFKNYCFSNKANKLYSNIFYNYIFEFYLFKLINFGSGDIFQSEELYNYKKFNAFKEIFNAEELKKASDKLNL